jgi:hypothetical protein
MRLVGKIAQNHPFFVISAARLLPAKIPLNGQRGEPKPNLLWVQDFFCEIVTPSLFPAKNCKK